MKEELGYVYERADGTVEYARNAEDVFARCPVLGRMALDQAQLFLDLASAGNEKMKTTDEAQKKREFDEEAEGAQDDDFGMLIATSPAASFELVTTDVARPEKEHSSFEREPETLTVNDQHRTPSKLGVGSSAKEKEVIKPVPETFQTTVATEKTSMVDQKAKRTERSALSQPAVAQSKKTIIPGINVESQAGLVKTGEVSSPEKELIENHVAVEEIPIIDVLPKEVMLQEAMLPPSDIEDMLPLSDTIDRDPELYEFSQVPTSEPEPLMQPNEVDAEFDTAKHTRQLFDVETIETYQKLLAVVDNETLEGKPLSIESADPLATDGSFDSVHNFEAFISAQPASEKQMGLVDIQNQVNEQALERTFHQLVELLSVVEEVKEVESNDLLEIMRAIEGVLAAYDSVHKTDETGEKRHISPEMTEKLLMLLQTLGYRNPSEVLVVFVDTHGLTFLIEALEFIHQMNSDDRTLLVSGISTAGDENDGFDRLHLGKILFGLIAKNGSETAA